MKMSSFIILNVILLFFLIGCNSMKKTIKNPTIKDDFSHLDYLEVVEGKASLKFAKDNTKLSNARLKTDYRYNKTYENILKIVTAKDKLPSFFQLNEEIYSFWQDSKYKRGILRKTSVKSFNSSSSQDKKSWEIILDIDKLAKTEKANWTYKHIECLPNSDLCLIYLSDGGKDATVIREFNLKTKQFVKNGFYIQESKSHTAWIDQDTLLLSDATDPKTLTTSGYPTITRILKRNQKISESEIISVSPKNYVQSAAFSLFLDNKTYTCLLKMPSFFESEFYLFNINNKKLVEVPVPLDANIITIFKGQLIFSTRKVFNNQPAGSLFAMNLDDISKKTPKIDVIFSPTQTTFYEEATRSKSHLWVSVLNNVKREVLQFSYTDSWKSQNVNLGDGIGNETLISADSNSEHLYFNYSDFLTPTSVYYVPESLSQKAKVVLKSVVRYKSDNLKISQYKVKSKDGTLVPYFIVYPKNIKYNSKNPTLLYGYGGFEISLTASYLGVGGKVWLEKGGVYVLANIRGGGEYGPDWHQAAVKENRHKAYEDFYAIAEDLIKRKITSPRHLGIRGGSNGGLLTSVAFTQRPELFNAVISEVPLANMLEYHHWLAGASWIEEYGDPDDKKMRKYLLSYSPLHNLRKEKKYPEVFFLTSTKDDRVHPAHARQMVARMKELGHPVLYNENTDGGHGRASNMTDLAEFLALEFVYLYQKLF